ncbi:MAG: toll/interleukin-1 receptor domain-containing protein [Candidatus Rokuibacteriota bacterium]
MIPMPRVFICYRRADAEAYAGRIHDRLAEVFPKDRLFMDVEALEPGEDFVTAIASAVGAVDVVIAVIGPKWMVAGDGRRLFENPRDWVRNELAQALQRNIRVIPVLVGGAIIPAPESLPPDLQHLTRLHAIEISHTRFASDVDRLIESLGRLDQQVEETPVPDRLRFGPSAVPSRWQRLSGFGRRAAAGAGKSRTLWLLTILQMLGVLGALGAAVAAPYRSFYLIMWAFLLLGVNGLVVSFLSHRRRVSRAARFGWTTAVISTVTWGFGILFPESLRVAPIAESQPFELGFRLFALLFGALTLFLGLTALLAIGNVSSDGRHS